MKEIRSLTEDDVWQTERIFNSRTHQLNDTKFFAEVQLHKLRHQFENSMGIFVDGVLDGFLAWCLYNDDAPRAGDPTKFDNPVAYINVNWFMNDPKRERTASGHNLNLQLVLLKMYEFYKEKKIYSHWHMTPANWANYVADPVIDAAIKAEWNEYTSPPIEVRHAPLEDAYGLFTAKHILPTNRGQEAFKIRVLTLREEFRTTPKKARSKKRKN